MTTALSVKQRQTLEREQILGLSPPITEVAEFIYILSKMTGVSGQIFNLDSRIVS
jgi:hypothetical protein